jgi:hypothetical protein
MSLTDRANFFRPTLLGPTNRERTGERVSLKYAPALRTMLWPRYHDLNALSQTAKMFAYHRGNRLANTAKEINREEGFIGLV